MPLKSTTFWGLRHEHCNTFPQILPQIKKKVTNSRKKKKELLWCQGLNDHKTTQGLSGHSTKRGKKKKIVTLFIYFYFVRCRYTEIFFFFPYEILNYSNLQSNKIWLLSLKLLDLFGQDPGRDPSRSTYESYEFWGIWRSCHYFMSWKSFYALKILY